VKGLQTSANGENRFKLGVLYFTVNNLGSAALATKSRVFWWFVAASGCRRRRAAPRHQTLPDKFAIHYQARINVIE
jgi:hypothetical protein